MSVWRPRLARSTEEEDAGRPAELDHAIDGGDGGEGFSGAGRHLDEGARAVLSEGALQAAHRFDLRRPEAGFDEGRQVKEAAAEGGVLGAEAAQVGDPGGKGFRAVE